MTDALVVPGNPVLVRVRGVVLLGHEVHEHAIGERLVPVRTVARHVDRNRIALADVLLETLSRLPVEHDDAHHPGYADEEIVLPPLVVVQSANNAFARAREVRLLDRLRQRARTDELGEPATLVFV